MARSRFQHLVLLAAALVVAPAFGEPSPAKAPSSSPTAPSDVLTISRAPSKADESPRVIGACDKAGGALRFGFAHFNDLQARYSDMLGGRSRYSYIAGYLKELKKAQPATIVLDAGDDHEKGALIELRSMGETTRQMVQSLPIDVRTIGNHDFAYGEIAVLRDVRLSQHPVLAANVKHTGLPMAKQPFRPYARFDVGCAKVGVIGLVTQNFGADDRPTDAPYDGVFVQDDHYQAILERESKAHRSEVDVLIALTHLGFADDVALAHRGGRFVDLIVGAHTEDLVKEPIPVMHQDNSRTYIMQAGHFGETLGKGDIVVSTNAKGERRVAIEKYKIVTVDESLPHDDAVAELAKKLEEAVAPDAHSPIGRMNATAKQGHAISDLVFKASAAAWGVDALIIGRDLYWASLPKGEITLQRMYDSLLVQRQPAGTNGFSSIWIAEVSGAELNTLARVFRPGNSYEWLGPQKVDPANPKRFKIGLDKRAATYPKSLFGLESKLVKSAAYMGELIDALEPYARARTAKGQTID